MEIVVLNPNVRSWIDPTIAPSQELAGIAAALQRAGHATDLIDADREDLPEYEVSRRIAALHPDLICVGVSTVTARFVKLAARVLRGSFPNVPMVAVACHPLA